LPPTLSSISVRRPSLKMPAPWTLAGPVVVALAIFPLMLLSRTVSRLVLPNRPRAPFRPASIASAGG
jgi:hypothetical protein